jgi:uncharacterized membrane protein
MDSQLHPSDPLDSTNPETVDLSDTANLSDPANIPNPTDMPDATALSSQSPVNQSLQKGQWIANQSSAFVTQFFDSLRRFFQENKQIVSIAALLIGVFIALRILFAVIDTINDILLLPVLFELIGIGYSIWFVNRYLLKTSDRQELSQELQTLKQQIFGDQQLLLSGTSSSKMPKAKSGRVNSATSLDVKRSVMIAKSPEELYHFWRNFENLPHFMNHLESVSVSDPKHSHWVAKAPLDTKVEWDAEIIQEEEPKTIVWRSMEGADVDSVGSVAFVPANGSGTQVKVTMAYMPPGGAVGAAVAAIFGENPEQQLEEDLSRLKQLMETGSVPIA